MKVFVYGTLRRGGRFNYLLNNSQFEGKALIFGYDLYDLGGDVPGIVAAPQLSNHVNIVAGEVYSINGPLLIRHLRMLEAGYVETSTVALVDGDETEVVVYVWPDKNLPYVGFDPPTLVPSGDWMER